MSSFEQLAVVMIVRNAEKVLADALASVPPGCEIIVADGGSSDATIAIARQCGARVVEQDLAAIERAGGVFDVARNHVSTETKRPWVLHLDADERLTPELVRSLKSLLAGEPAHNGYDMPRINFYWGRPVRLLAEDRQIRLVRSGRGRFSSDALHQKMEVDGTVGSLDGSLIHLNVRDWRDVATWFRNYVPLEARTLGRRPRLLETLARGPHLFRYFYFRNRAFRDGPRGFVVSAIYAAYGAAVLWTARRMHSAES